MLSALSLDCDLRQRYKESNVLLIMANDLVYSDIAGYYGEFETPNLDLIVAQGIRFNRINNASICYS
jgi:arylsulfatase A-like enzyme